MIDLKLPDEVVENLPEGRDEMVRYLAKYFDTVIAEYDVRFQKRMTGAFGSPLSKYEKSILKDFLIDQTLGKLEENSLLAAEVLTESTGPYR